MYAFILPNNAIHHPIREKKAVHYTVATVKDERKRCWEVWGQQSFVSSLKVTAVDMLKVNKHVQVEIQ